MLIRSLTWWLLGCAPALAQTVHTVDDDGPAAFTDIQAAVDAASSGDLIAVSPGGYSGFLVVAKGLTIVGTGGPGTSVVVGPVAVAGTGHDQATLIQNLDVYAEEPASGQTMAIDACAGVVTLEYCRLRSAVELELGIFPYYAGGGLYVRDAARVSLRNCELVGAPGYSFLLSYPSRPGLTSQNATIAAYDCQIIGGTGVGGQCQAFVNCSQVPVESSPGLVQTGGQVLLNGGFLAGGNGGQGALQGDCGTGLPSPAGGYGGDGMPAASLESADARLYLVDVDLHAGVGGAGACGAGSDAPTFSTAPGASVDQLSGASRALIAFSPVVGGLPTQVAVLGQAGDLVFGLWSLQADLSLLLPFSGALTVGPGFVVDFVGVADGLGVAVVQPTLAAPQPGVPFYGLRLQPASISTGLQLFLGGARTVVVLP